MANELYFLVVLCFCLFESVCCNLLCDSSFCRTYVDETGCTVTAQECGINNATHKGMNMPSPTTCNCCDFCLPLYGLDQVCSTGGPGMGTTVGRCGDGLTCVQGTDGNSYCRRMESACHKAQDQFEARHEKGESGALEERPTCDGKGKYGAFSCVPTQTCFCQSQEGERIFGEVLYEGTFTKNNMHCACKMSLKHNFITHKIKWPKSEGIIIEHLNFDNSCSRFNYKIQKQIEPAVRYNVVGPRCTSDGNFHPIQCINDVCYCVNTITGVVLEGNKRKIDLKTEPLSRLECYDPNLDFFPERNFSTPCLDSRNEKIELLLQSEAEGFNMDYFSTVSSCLPDGTYGKISTRRTRKVCVDERGLTIGNYEALIGTDEYKNMDCKCAITARIMTSQQEQPVCCKNGNFRPIQCRRGLCRCVDSDGRQTEKENLDVTKLSCYTKNWRSC